MTYASQRGDTYREIDERLNQHMIREASGTPLSDYILMCSLTDILFINLINFFI